MRWRIDVKYCYGWAPNPMGKFVLERERFCRDVFGRKRPDWETIGYFDTREQAKAAYEQIKDLPEYLNG